MNRVVVHEGNGSKAALPQLPQEQKTHSKVTKKLKDFEVVATRMEQKMQKKFIDQFKKYFLNSSRSIKNILELRMKKLKVKR